MARTREFNLSIGDIIRRMVDRPATNDASMALMWGVAWLIVGAILGWSFDLVPTSMIGYTWGSAPLVWHTAMGLVMWVSSTVIFYAVAITINRKVSIVELFGRMLFAHWPVTILMLPGIMADKFAYSTYMANPVVAFKQSPVFAALMSIVVVLVMVWYAYWGYCAFRRSTSRSGALIVVAYVVAFVLSLWLSRYALTAIYAGIG